MRQRTLLAVAAIIFLGISERAIGSDGQGASQASDVKWTDVSTIVLTAIAVGFSVFSYARAREATALTRDAHGALSLREFVMHEYVDREFRATEAPTIEGSKITRLRVAKICALKALTENPEKWASDSDVSCYQRTGNWQNSTAFETADALELMGLAVYTGIIPLGFALALLGDVIVDDWLISHNWVRSYRQNQKIVLPMRQQPPAVHYHRRHAE